jgi:hypothetical protein
VIRNDDGRDRKGFLIGTPLDEIDPSKTKRCEDASHSEL